MADSSFVEVNIVTDAVDSTGSTVISAIQSNIIESTSATATITTGGVGPQGEVGPTGPQGEVGPQGETGADGGVSSVNDQTGIVVLTQDNVGDGTTFKRYSATEKTKLSGIAIAATANDSDANLKSRANHTGTQAQSTITNLTSDLAAKQPLDSDLTTIAGLTATTDNFMVATSSAWASRTPTQARTQMGLGSIATQASSSVTITGGSITGITDITIADGGTGASTASGARTNLSVGEATGWTKLSVGTSTPSSPATGDLWVDTN